MTVTVPLRLPTALGVNVTRMVQLLPGASAAPQSPVPALTRWKSPLTVMLVMASGAPPLLVSVRSCGALVVPTI